jgi:hypothetical protein
LLYIFALFCTSNGPFLSPFASLSYGGGWPFPSPMPAARWRSPPAQLQARPNQESEFKGESDRVGPRSPSPRASPIGFGPRIPSPRASPIGFGPRIPSPRTSPIGFGSENPRASPGFFYPRVRVHGRVRLPLGLRVRWTPESSLKKMNSVLLS